MDGTLSPTVAWTVVIVFWALPLVHVMFSRHAGSWAPPPDAGCPFGPRVGWLVVVLFLGALGWVMFARRKIWGRPHAG